MKIEQFLDVAPIHTLLQSAKIGEEIKADESMAIYNALECVSIEVNRLKSELTNFLCEKYDLSESDVKKLHWRFLDRENRDVSMEQFIAEYKKSL